MTLRGCTLLGMGRSTRQHRDEPVSYEAAGDQISAFPLTALVESAGRGERAAWDELFRRFDPLVRSVCRRYRISPADADDVSQSVWLKLLEHVGRLRDPRALPGWIATTTSHQCLREVERRRRTVAVNPLDTDRTELETWSAMSRTVTDDVDDALLREESRRAVQEDLSGLSSKEQGLLLRLMADPPLPYSEISRELDMPIGSIGPTRARCLSKLRKGSAARAFAAQHGGRSAVAA
jgi:RNA polymerase sigma factor (sigma-70 family)